MVCQSLVMGMRPASLDVPESEFVLLLWQNSCPSNSKSISITSVISKYILITGRDNLNSFLTLFHRNILVNVGMVELVFPLDLYITSLSPLTFFDISLVNWCVMFHCTISAKVKVKELHASDKHPTD